MMVTDSIPKKKLKIRIASKKIEAVSGSEASEISHRPWMNNVFGDNISLNENKEALMKKSVSYVPHSRDNQKFCVSDCSKAGSAMQGCSKRGLPGAIDFHKEKRQKMDHSAKQQCARILKTLMAHPASLGFKEPVDPVLLNIPDYFSVITKPMDLGTINAKLQDDKYFSVDEFSADVRLTFSNAMTYNPPGNRFNKAARTLNSIFNSKLKSLEAKWTHESMNVEESFPRKSSAHFSSLSKVSMSIEEKGKLRKELVEAMKGKMTVRLRTFLQHLGLSSGKGELSGIELDGYEDRTLLELQRLVNDALQARTATGEPAKTVQNGSFPSGKVLHKGKVSANRSSCGSVKTVSPLRLVTSKCHLCGSVRCQCSGQNKNVHASSVDLSTKSSLRQDRGVSKMEHEVKDALTCSTRKSDLESEGSGSVFDEGNICSSPQLSTIGWTPGFDIQLSPEKALRAAMLKSRFADTIVKAKQKTLLEKDDKVDPVKLLKEKEKLEKQQQEEKARCEAQIKAAQVASMLRAQEELRMRREREREAARMALQKMEKTVEIDENLKFLRELEMFSRNMSSSHLFDGADKSKVLAGARDGDQFGSPLEQLGLFIKDDYMDEYEDSEQILNEEGEEGEILS